MEDRAMTLDSLRDGIVTDAMRLALAEAIERALPVFDVLAANAQPADAWDAGIIIDGERL